MGRRENSGRKLDSIWAEFNKLSDTRVSCRHCLITLPPLVARMRKHFEQSHANIRQPEIENASTELETSQDVIEVAPPPQKQPRIGDFVVKTTSAQKEKWDKDVGKFFFENNIPFKAVESSTFKNLCAQLHPGYKRLFLQSGWSCNRQRRKHEQDKEASLRSAPNYRELWV